MKNFFKALFRILLGGIIILIAAIVLVINFVDPSQFKGTIEEETLATTGHVLKIQGPIRWQWYPMLSLEFNQVILDNIPPFGNQMFSANKIKASFDFLPLLAGKLFVNLNLVGSNIVLERNASGQENFANFTKLKSKEDEHSKPLVHILLNSINVENGQVIYHEQAKDQHYMLTHLNIKAENLLQGIIRSSNPISVRFRLDNLNKHTVGEISLAGNWSFNPLSEAANIDKIVFKFTPPNGKALTLNGKLNSQGFSSPKITGNLETENFHLMGLFKELDLIQNPAPLPLMQVKADFEYHALKLSVNNLQVALKNSGAIEGTIQANFKENPFKIAALDGSFSSKTLKIDQLEINELKAAVKGKDDIYNVASFDFKIAESQQKLALLLNLHENQMQCSITQEGEPFELKQVLSAFGLNTKIEGQTQLKLKLLASGNTIEQLKKTLSGNVQVQITDGKIRKIDLVPLLKRSISTVHDLLTAVTQKRIVDSDKGISAELKQWDFNPSNLTASTPFSSLTATMTINNGVLNNPDLSITHPEYHVTGHGVVNIAANSLDYKVGALLKNNPYPSTDEIGNYLFRTPLPIQITGSIEVPIVRPDLKAFFNSSLSYVQKNLVEKLIQNTVDKAINKLIKSKQ